MNSKIRPEHLARLAIVYIRQSTLAQVLEHRQSTERQYNLAEHAKRLGWDDALVQVVDEDLAHSGESAANRSGFQRVAADVSLSRVGAIFSLEVSRLARSEADWHRLLELCALSDCLIIDDDGVYDPNDFNDRLVLGMKGTMSDAERHLMRLRLQGGKMHKAKKGQLGFQPATGYALDVDGKLVFDPDEHVQEAVRLLFERFRLGGSAHAVARYFAQHNLQFPSRHPRKDGAVEMRWKPLTNVRVLRILQNPIYAGAYAYGRKQDRRALVDGAIRRRAKWVDQGEWHALLRDAHPAYITWETYMANLERIEKNNTRSAALDQKGGPRNGDALLQGIAVCGRCGRRMSPVYQAAERPRYACRNAGVHQICWSAPARTIDEKIEDLILETVAPSEIDLSLAVIKEVERQAGDVDRQWKLRIDRARYEAQRAERQYNAVEPENRVVARTLETRWNEKLQELEQAERDHEETRRSRKLVLSTADRKAILALARDLPKVWRAETTTQAERKQIVRLLIEDAVLSPVDVPERGTQVRLLWKTGAISELFVPRPKLPWRTSEDTLVLIRKLAKKGLADAEIAEELNRRGIKSGRRLEFTPQAITMIRSGHEIDSGRARGEHLPASDRDARGRYSIRGLAAKYGVTNHIVRYWIKCGILTPEQDHTGGPFWITLTPEIHAAIRQARQAGYGPRQARVRRNSSTNSNARSKVEG